MPKGRLITLEGIDGTGKSSIAKMLEERFRDAVFTREPTGNWIGKAVKRSIESDIDPFAELFLFMADHAEHISKLIRPALREGKTVISDRYSDSRYAYQGATLSDLVDDAIEWVKSVHKGWTIVPDLTILFTVDPTIAVSRCGIRGDHTKFEKIEFLKIVQGNYLELAKREPQRFVIIDAAQAPGSIGDRVEAVISEFLKK
ncbi:MAG: dTMP kinase [Candidatus Methanoperedens sp.]|nr:dTMP kinase [Candidatus Methanoperedens sp.]MCZ7361016.1 dTMP kinase [Candidatus Methanoperedens sp.]HLB72287.1 dTMP kinase [Candidatus Methanoperedens sp.]